MAPYLDSFGAVGYLKGHWIPFALADLFLRGGSRRAGRRGGRGIAPPGTWVPAIRNWVKCAWMRTSSVCRVSGGQAFRAGRRPDRLKRGQGCPRKGCPQRGQGDYMDVGGLGVDFLRNLRFPAFFLCIKSYGKAYGVSHEPAWRLVSWRFCASAIPYRRDRYPPLSATAIPPPLAQNAGSASAIPRGSW